MALLGMLTMGLFVGLVAVQGTQINQSVDQWLKTMVAILGACFGGVVVTFMNRQMRTSGNAIYMYPVGLLLGYCWFQTPILANMLLSSEVRVVLEGFSGIVGNIAITVVALCLTIPSAIEDAKALKKERSKEVSQGYSAER